MFISYLYFSSLKNLYLFVFGTAGFTLLNGLFSICGKQELSLVAVHGLLIAVFSLVPEHGL